MPMTRKAELDKALSALAADLTYQCLDELADSGHDRYPDIGVNDYVDVVSKAMRLAEIARPTEDELMQALALLEERADGANGE